jgi:hypothetical protein
MSKILTCLVLIGLMLAGCKKEENACSSNTTGNLPESGWTIPSERLMISQFPLDPIPSIDDPHFEALNDQNLTPDEMVYVYRHGNTVKVYPQNILWHHEIVNDHIDEHHFAVTFCPLTGSTLA